MLWAGWKKRGELRRGKKKKAGGRKREKPSAPVPGCPGRKKGEGGRLPNNL